MNKEFHLCNRANWLFLSNHSFHYVGGWVKTVDEFYSFIFQEVVTICVVFICHNSEKWNQDKEGRSLTVSNSNVSWNLGQEMPGKCKALTCVSYANFWFQIDDFRSWRSEWDWRSPK